jgi:hypothetical protein
VPAGILAIAGCVGVGSASWWTGLLTTACLSIALWQFFLPVAYEVQSQGICRQAFGRTRIVPWHAIRAYRPCAIGIMLFQRPDPAGIDALRGLFVPYGDHADEALCAVREHLRQAVELPAA